MSAASIWNMEVVTSLRSIRLFTFVIMDYGYKEVDISSNIFKLIVTGFADFANLNEIFFAFCNM